MICRGYDDEYFFLLNKAKKLSKPTKRKKFGKKFKKFLKYCLGLAPFIGAVAALLTAFARLRSSGRRKGYQYSFAEA